MVHISMKLQMRAQKLYTVSEEKIEYEISNLQKPVFS